MGIVIRQSAKNWLVSCMGAVLGALVIWLSTKFIPKQQYGFLGLMTQYAVVVSQILLFGLNHTLTVYIHRYANDPRQRKLLITLCLSFPAIIAILLSVVYFFIRSWLLPHFQPADQPFMAQYYMWIPAFTLFFIYMVILEQYLGSQMKVAVSAFVREVLLRLANIALVLLFGFGYISFSTFVALTVLVYVPAVLIYFLLSARTKGFGFSTRLSDFSRAEYREFFHFSWYHFLLGITILLMGSMDVLLLPFYDHSGFNSVAVYRVAVFLISLMLLPSKALMTASYTALARAFSEKDLPRANDIFVRSSINILIPTLAFALLLSINLGNITAVVNNGYAEIAPVFLILFIGRITDSATGMNDQVITITNFYRFNFYLSLVLMVMLFVLLRTLIPGYGVYGAAWGTTATLVLFNIAKFLFVWKKMGMQPFTKKTSLVLVCALPALAIGYFFPHFFDQAHHVYVHTAADVALRSTVALAVYLSMLLWLRPSADLHEYLASIWKNKRLF